VESNGRFSFQHQATREKEGIRIVEAQCEAAKIPSSACNAQIDRSDLGWGNPSQPYYYAY
jgi:hypothetical protein